jgi:Rad3-related DNA helicase
VAEALVTGTDLVVQAGTGTGKSLAYLVPAAKVKVSFDFKEQGSTSDELEVPIWDQQPILGAQEALSGKKVVVATATKRVKGLPVRAQVAAQLPMQAPKLGTYKED